MTRTGRAILICVALLGGEAGQADTWQSLEQLNICSAHFKARADWLTSLNRNETAAGMFYRYSERLLADAVASTPDAADCAMLVMQDQGECDPGRIIGKRNETATEILTAFTLQGYGKAGLPTCMEDAVCLRCMDLLRERAP
ncbi:MAG: hypothetical protein JSR87_04605 [Proteobacteria bacterium]|nr:hypothetical protein [Pseudomonadota bacterium]MBS0574310.1 hypothetical protein [Pseudomonadota bacterium]